MIQPLISILTPFKNTEAYIDACIASIQAQCYKNWELVIVNDHSTDRSPAIVSDYAKNDKRIMLLNNQGHGIIDALRMAFKHSNGHLITRMDSDDIMAENKLQLLSNNLIQKGKKHIALGLVSYFSDDGIKNGFSRYEQWLNNLTRNGLNFSALYKECVIPSPCWMVHRDDLIAADAFNPNTYPEDYDLAFRFYKKGYACIPCDDTLHYWRDYPTRTSRTHKHYASNAFIDLKLDYFIKLHYNSKRPLVIWGAGNKGKAIAKQLLLKGIPFHWVCNNPKKIGKDIYNLKLLPFTAIATFNKPHSIIAVANTESQTVIREFLTLEAAVEMKDYFFFC